MAINQQTLGIYLFGLSETQCDMRGQHSNVDIVMNSRLLHYKRKDQLLLVKLDQSTVLLGLWSVARCSQYSTLPYRLSTPVLRGERLELVEVVFCLPVTLPAFHTIF